MNDQAVLSMFVITLLTIITLDLCDIDVGISIVSLDGDTELPPDPSWN